MRCVNFFLIILFLLSSLSTQAEALESESKLKLAQQLAKINQLDKAIEDAAKNAMNIFKFKKKVQGENLQKKQDLAAAEALAKFEKAAPKIIEEAKKNIVDALVNKFSAAELKYLLDLSRNPLYVKMKEFNESSQLKAALELPLDKASALRNEALSK